MEKTLVITAALMFIQVLKAQEKSDPLFDKVNAESFVLPDSPFLKEASAVVIADKGSCDFFGSKAGRLTVSYKGHVRIKIQSLNGYTLAKAKTIFGEVKQKFTCTGNDYIDSENQHLRQVYQDKKGTVSELNLLLVAMLEHEHTDAYPAILSTRKNGYALIEFPLLRQFYKTIACTRIGGTGYFQDASD